MGSQNTFQLLCQAFEQNILDNKLLNELKQKQLYDKKVTIKIYLLQFLLDLDKGTSISSQNDLWYIKDNEENKNIINNYILLLIDLLKKEENDLDNEIIKGLESFIETDVSNKIFYMFSILNKFNVTNLIYLLYLGFILGEKKEFIKKNYINNLKDLFISFDTDFSKTISKRLDFYFNEKTLEILNLYVFFNLHLKDNYKSINAIKNHLINPENSDFNISKYYSLLDKEKLLDSLFFIENTTFSNGIFNKKELILIDNIKNEIKEFNDKEDEDIENLSLNNSLQENKVPLDVNEFPKINTNLGEIEKKVNSVTKNQDKNKHVQRVFEESNGNTHDKIKDNSILSNKFQKKEDNTDSNVNPKYIDSKSKNNNKISEYLNILEKIHKLIDFPKKDELNITKEKEDDENNIMNQFAFFLNTADELSNLRKNVGEFKYFLENWLSEIPELLKKIKNNSNFKLLEITNLRLEILIHLLKSPNIINIKRKIIEIMIFHLYSENTDYFELDNDYVPTSKNISDLEKLIKAKSNDDIKNDDLLHLQSLLDQKKPDINETQKSVNHSKNYNMDKKNKLRCAKSFLEFYKTKLNPFVHIFENKGQFYLLPRNMFSSETNFNKYLCDLESIIGKNGNVEKNGEKNKIVGMKMENEIFDINIYKEKKLLTVDEAIDILFSFNSKINAIENSAILQIEQKQKEFKEALDKIYDTSKNVIKIKISSTESEIDYDEEIVKQINNYVEIFEKDVIQNLSNILNSLLFEDEINDNDEIINKLNSFLDDFIKSCKIKLHKIKDDHFKDINQILYFIIIKTLMVQKMAALFECLKKKVIEKILNKEKEFLELTKIIKSNLHKLKKYVEEKIQFENVFDIFVEWNKKENYYIRGLTINELVEFYKDNIKEEMDLEKNLFYDTKFCLWAIKKGFKKYFD